MRLAVAWTPFAASCACRAAAAAPAVSATGAGGSSSTARSGSASWAAMVAVSVSCRPTRPAASPRQAASLTAARAAATADSPRDSPGDSPGEMPGDVGRGGETRLDGSAERAIGRHRRLSGGADGCRGRLGRGGQALRLAAGGGDGGVEVDGAAQLGAEFSAALRRALGGRLGLVPGRLALLGQLGAPGVALGDGVVEPVKRALAGGQRGCLRRQPGGFGLEALRVGVGLPGGGGQAGRVGSSDGARGAESAAAGSAGGAAGSAAPAAASPASAEAASSRAAKPACLSRCASSPILPSAAATSRPALSALAVAWSASALAASSASRLTGSKVGSTGSG